MIKRVKFINNQKIVIKIYEKNEHKISLKNIDSDAVNIIKRIKQTGDEAYIVGGAVRDLMLKKPPKDFDIATSMHPQQIRRYFRNARIIGKRFKLALLMFKAGKQIEVATFRSLESGNYESQVYGDMDEDAQRRDYSINALYYDPITERLYDYHNGFEDLKNKKLVSVIDVPFTFTEDPVRMIRGVKYSVKDSLEIDDNLKNAICSNAYLLQEISTSRLAEEAIKIFVSTQSYEIFTALHEYNLLKYILPIADDMIKKKEFKKNLKTFDSIVVKRKKLSQDDIITLAIVYILRLKYDKNQDYSYMFETCKNKKEKQDAAIKFIKKDFNNLNFANYIYFKAAKILIFNIKCYDFL